jgi:hypothetical protein
VFITILWMFFIHLKRPLISNARETFIDRTENIANPRAQDLQNCNDNNGNKNEKQCLLNQSLALFGKSE